MELFIFDIGTLELRVLGYNFSDFQNNSLLMRYYIGIYCIRIMKNDGKIQKTFGYTLAYNIIFIR